MRKAVVLLGALVLAVVTGVGAGASPDTVAARGGEQFVPNAMIQSTFHFSPGKVNAVTGQDLTWVDKDRVGEPHTATIVEEADLPTSLAEVFGCQEQGQPCGDALAGHFPPGDPPVPVIDVGAPGIDSPGDSLLFFPDGSISGTISAPAGTTLFYLCALHPWMQGSITVR
jgi:plastocyanin